MENRPVIFFDRLLGSNHWPPEFFAKLLICLLASFLAACLIYVLTRLFKRYRRLSLAERIEDPKDIREVLSIALRQKGRFKVHINARRQSFNSMLLNISPASLLIDALFPVEGNDLIADSNFIEVNFNLRESELDMLLIPYTFKSAFIQAETFRGYPSLRIQTPTLIRRVQRRNYLRIDPPVKAPIYIDFDLDGKQVTERIANISGGGVGFYTGFSRSVLWRGRRLEHIHISLPGCCDLNCSATVHSLTQSERPVLLDGKTYHFFCGAEFTDLEDPVREQVIQYTREKEREALKKISRGYE